MSFLYKHNDIVSVEGGSIVLYVECLGGMFIREFCFKVAQFDESYRHGIGFSLKKLKFSTERRQPRVC